MTITLPSGHQVKLGNLTDYVQSGATIVFSYAAGYNVSPWVETFLSAASAAFAIEQIKGVEQAGQSSGTILITGSPVFLASVSPNPFDVHVDSVNIYGRGFDPATLGAVYIEDSGGGLGGVVMSVSFVSPTHLIANWISDGDGTTNNMLVYVDQLGRVSNFILVNGGPSLTWASVSPNAVSIPIPVVFTATGTGFSLSGINSGKFDDGMGNFSEFDFVTINSDISISFHYGGGNFFPGVNGTYTLYYSTDNGLSFVTTGLTVVES